MQDLLQKYGARFSLRFTIEYDQTDQKKLSPLRGHYIDSPQEFENKSAFLDALKTWVPEADVKMDEIQNKPRIGSARKVARQLLK